MSKKTKRKPHWLPVDGKRKRKKAEADPVAAYLASIPAAPPGVPGRIIVGNKEIWRNDPRNDHKTPDDWPGDEAAKQIHDLYAECVHKPDTPDWNRYERQVAKVLAEASKAKGKKAKRR